MSFPSLIVMPVSNLESAKMVYSKLLDTDPYVDSAYYVGFHAGEGEIGLDPNGTGGPLAYWDVDDLEATIDALVQAGATISKAPSEVGGGLTIAVLTDADGNAIGLRQTS